MRSTCSIAGNFLLVPVVCPLPGCEDLTQSSAPSHLPGIYELLGKRSECAQPKPSIEKGLSVPPQRNQEYPVSLVFFDNLSQANLWLDLHILFQFLGQSTKHPHFGFLIFKQHLLHIPLWSFLVYPKP
jgi:hypothetical protein